MPSTNESLADRTLTHAVYLLRLSAAERAEVFRQLDRLERDLIRDLEHANLTAFRRDRITRLLKQTRATIRAAYREMRDAQQEKLVDLADLESQWTVRAINGAVGADIGISIPVASVAWTPQQLKAIAGNVAIENTIVRDWWAKQATDLSQRFSDVIKQGVLRGSTNDEIIRLVRGTKVNEFTDGIMEVSRRQAEALVRTSVQAVSNEARLATYHQNERLIKGVEQKSTLDGRTSEICIGYSRKQWTLDGIPIGHNLPFNGGPPRHFNCRSTLVSILKSWSELTGRALPQADNQTLDAIFQQKLRDRGWSEERIATARRNTQASMDGQISKDIDYQTWLRGKGAAFQDDVLGVGKADLFRRGILTDLTQLLDMRGTPLTLAQLKQRYGIPL